MLAVNNRDLAMTQLLLESGAKVNLVDSNGDPALNWACFYGDLAAVQLLLQHGADATPVGHGNALEVAMRRGHQPLVERLVDHLKLRLVPAAADQRLIAAIDTGDAAAAKAALAAGANANALDAAGRPLLARAGAKLDARDSEQATPLLWAINGDAAAAQVLVELGADPDLPPQAGESPRKIAMQREMKDLLAAMQRLKPL